MRGDFAWRSVVAKLMACASVMLVMVVAGCASAPQVVPVPYSVTVKADQKINLDSRGRPSPLKVVVYELKSPAAFEAADFFALSQKDQATLGTELVAREEFFLRPGETRVLLRKGSLDVTALGVFVELRDIEKSIWRVTAVTPAPEKTGLLASVRSSSPPPKNYEVLLDQRGIQIIAP